MNFRLLRCGQILAAALLIILLLGQTAARADYTSFNGSAVARNIAIIRITDSGVQVQFEVYVGDIEKFEALVPDSWLNEGDATRPPLAERMAEFAETGLSIRRPDGTALPVTANLVEPRIRIDRASPLAGQLDPIRQKVVPSPPADPRVLYAELFYPFNGDRPDTLVFAPPMDAQGKALVDIGMAVYDHEVPVVEFRFLARKATLNIEWQDPWYTRFTDENLWRRSRFPMTAYLYLDPYEVRHEALIRVRDAIALVGMKPEGPWLTKAETEQLMGLITPAVSRCSVRAA